MLRARADPTGTALDDASTSAYMKAASNMNVVKRRMAERSERRKVVWLKCIVRKFCDVLRIW